MGVAINKHGSPFFQAAVCTLLTLVVGYDIELGPLIVRDSHGNVYHDAFFDCIHRYLPPRIYSHALILPREFTMYNALPLTSSHPRTRAAHSAHCGDFLPGEIGQYFTPAVDRLGHLIGDAGFLNSIG